MIPSPPGSVEPEEGGQGCAAWNRQPGSEAASRRSFWTGIWGSKVIGVPKIIYPLVICYIAIENGPVEIVDFPIKHGDFPVRYVIM